MPAEACQLSSSLVEAEVADFKWLKVWEAGHRVSVDIYALVKTLPRDEQYGLRSQMTRAAGSIPANIAEGVGRGTDGDLSRFLDIAMDSATELECQVLRARDLKFVTPEPAAVFLRQVDEVQKMLVGLRRRVRQRRAR